MEWLIVFSPILLFALLIMIVIIALRRSNYKLADALSGDEAILTDEGKQGYPRSVSRLMLFICGLTSIVLVLGFVTAQLYVFIIQQKDTMLDFRNIIVAAITLGMGVIPYSVKQVAAALRK